MTVAAQPMETYGSASAVTTCRPSSATANSESVRCSSAVTKRADRRGAQPSLVAAPSAMTTGSSTSRTMPLPRDRNQRHCGLAMERLLHRGLAESWQLPAAGVRPAADQPYLAVMADKAGRQ